MTMVFAWEVNMCRNMCRPQPGPMLSIVLPAQQGSLTWRQQEKQTGIGLQRH